MKKQTFITILFLLCLPSFLLAQEIRRPTIEDSDYTMTDTISCVLPNDGVYDPVSGNFTGYIEYFDMDSLPNFYDPGGSSTFSTSVITASSGGEMKVGETAAKLYYGFAAASGEYTELKLNIDSACTRVGATGSSRCAIEYSLDNKATWTLLRNGSWTRTTNTLTLSTSQDLSQVVVRVCTYAQMLATDTEIGTAFQGFDIWTAGTTVIPIGDPSRRRTIVVAK